MVNSPALQIPQQQAPSLKDSFKPTILKILIITLLLIIILSSHIANQKNIPVIEEKLCNPENQNLEEITKNIKSIALGNFYIYASQVYKLNPFFPTSCEIIGTTEFTANSCRYYIEEKSFNCLQVQTNQQTEIQSLFTMPTSSTYKKINTFSLIFHTIILSAILYLLMSLLSFLNKYLTRKTKLITFITISFIISITYLIFGKLLLMTFISTILLTLFSLIKKESTQKIILYILFGLLIIGSIIGLFIINNIIIKGLS